MEVYSIKEARKNCTEEYGKCSDVQQYINFINMLIRKTSEKNIKRQVTISWRRYFLTEDEKDIIRRLYVKEGYGVYSFQDKISIKW